MCVAVAMIFIDSECRHVVGAIYRKEIVCDFGYLADAEDDEGFDFRSLASLLDGGKVPPAPARCNGNAVLL